MTTPARTSRRVPPAWACPRCRSEGVILGPGPRRECVDCGNVWTDSESSIHPVERMNEIKGAFRGLSGGVPLREQQNAMTHFLSASD